MSEAWSDEQIMNMIDNVLQEMDKDKNGFISYSEFMKTEPKIDEEAKKN